MSSQEAGREQSNKRGVGLRLKLIAAFLFLTMLIGACGGAGLFYVARIDSAVTRFAEIASPMLAASLRLSDNAQQMRAELQAALNSRDGAGAAPQIARLATLATVGEQGLEALTRLTAASGQDLKIEEAARLREEFVRRIKQAIEAQSAGSAAAALTSERYAVFDAQIQELDGVLAGLAASIEAAMTKIEEEAKAKVQGGEATAEWLGASFLETLTNTYPAVQSVYRLMRESVKLQELTKSHLAQTKPDDLEAIEQEAQKTLRAATTLARRLAARLRSGDGRTEAAKITQAMTAMNLSLLADDGLFAANRQQFDARAQIRTEQAGFAQAQEAYLALLARVETAAAQMNADSKTSVEAGVRDSLTSVEAFMAGGVLIGLVFGLLFARSLVGPLTRLTEAMRRLAQGALETDVPELGRADEIGQMAATVAVFKENGLELRRAEADKQEAEARAEAQKREAALRLAADFDASVGAIVAAVAQTAADMRRAAEALNETAGMASLQAGAASSSSDQVSGNVQTVASSSEELAASIGEIGSQVAMSSRIASAAVGEAADTDAKVQGLARAADQIGAVVNLISEIAAQTNLLALNATIEAARAGDAGRGFAVVATEVKSLATQTARATEEISTKVAEIQAATGGSVTAIRSIGRTIGEMNEIATSIASAVEEQGAATHEIARNVQEAARATQEVSANVNGVTQASAATGEACAQLLKASGGLSAQAESLRQEVDQFLRRVRAA